MKTVLFFFTMCLMNSNSGFSQEKPGIKHADTPEYAITITPTLFPYAFIGLQSGFQFKIGNKHALISEMAFPVIRSGYSDYDKNRFFKIASELKFYPKRKFIEQQFLSLQIGLIYRSFQDKDSGIYQSTASSERIGYSALKIKSPAFFGDVKWGIEVVKWKKTFVDIFWALGVRVVPTKYDAERSYVIGPAIPSKRTFFSFIPASSWEHDKTVIKPHAAFGVRIGKRF